MERSDPPRLAATPPAEAKHEPNKPAVEEEIAADRAAPVAQSVSDDMTPREAPDVDAPDAEAADAPPEPPDEIHDHGIGAPADRQPSVAQAEPDEAVVDGRQPDPPLDTPYVETLEPWPDPLEMTQPPAAPKHARGPEPQPDADADAVESPDGLPRYPPAQRHPLPELPATYEDIETSSPDAGTANAAPAASPVPAFEPTPFAVPPPVEAPRSPVHVEPQKPALGPVASRLAAAANRPSSAAPPAEPEMPEKAEPAADPQPVAAPAAWPPSSPPDAGPAAAESPAEPQIPSPPPADPFADPAPNFSEPSAQQISAERWTEPLSTGLTSTEPAFTAPDFSEQDAHERTAWSEPLGSSEDIHGSAYAAQPPHQLSADGFGEMTAAMAASSLPPMTAVVPEALTEQARPQRDWRDLVRRLAHAAFLIFAGWFIAVLVLIVVYRFVNPPFSMLMAQQFVSGTRIQKQWVPLERISPNLRRAVIVSEDGRFCQHWGVDLVEAANALRRASDGYPRGASTITMQVAKNLFLLPVKSYVRKLIELPLTFAIELAWPKARILEIYLNIVEWGPGVFGAEAASQAHFRRSAMNLTPRQAAQLAVALPNPIVRNAGRPGPRTARRASVIQKRAAGARGASACVDTAR